VGVANRDRGAADPRAGIARNDRTAGYGRPDAEFIQRVRDRRAEVRQSDEARNYGWLRTRYVNRSDLLLVYESEKTMANLRQLRF